MAPSQPENGMSDLPNTPEGKVSPRYKRPFVDLLQALRVVRPDRLRYMLFFSLAPIFPNMKNTLVSGAVPLFGMDLVFLMGIAYSLGIGLLFILSRLEQVQRFARILAVSSAVLFAAWLLLPHGQLASWAGLLYSLAFGGCAGIALFGFSYALNKHERLFGAALTSLFCLISQIILSLPRLHAASGPIYVGLQVAVTLVCLPLYRTEDYAPINIEPSPSHLKPLALMLVFFFSHRAIVFFFSYLPQPGPNFFVNLAGILVFLLSLLIYFAFNFSIRHLCNLFFAGMTLAWLIRLLVPDADGVAISNVAYSFSHMGFIASYYLLGRNLRDHASFAWFKWMLVAIFAGSMLLHVVPSRLSASFPKAFPLIGTIVTFCLFLLFMLLTPTLFKRFYTQGQMEDQQARREDWMRRMHLTQREQEIALLMLEGNTMKQAAATLGISVDTVKFHSGNIYKKLDIRGRNELLRVLKDV